MCYAVIEAKFGPGEEAQMLKPATSEECLEKVAALEANPHCVAVKVFMLAQHYARESVWVERKVKP